MASVTVTREELYEQVWETPLVRLAVQYGVSNVALGKTCRRLNIPLPGRGYWARVAAGEKVTRPPLPKSTAAQAWVRLARDPAAEPVRAKRDGSVPQVTVAETLDAAHEAVRRVAALLPRAHPDQHDRLSAGCLLVTLETHKRALLLLDGLCKAIDSRGHRVEFRRVDGRTASLAAVVDGEPVFFTISERLERTARVASSQAGEAVERKANAPKYDYWPGGCLRVDIPNTRLARSMWSDTDTRRLDQLLGQALLGIEAAAEDHKRRREEEKERKREEEQWREQQIQERAKQERQRRLREYQLLLARDLDRRVAAWVHAEEVRDFLDAYEASLSEEHRTEVVGSWLGAARRYAARLDPLTDIASIPRAIEPPDDVLERAIADLKALEESLRGQ